MTRGFSLCAAIALFAALGPARADELTLKDGSKINGAIVGFEAHSFRVKTSYGFAVVRKDEVVSIRVTDTADGESNEKPSTSAAGTSAIPDESAKAPVPIASAKTAQPQPGASASRLGAAAPTSRHGASAVPPARSATPSATVSASPAMSGAATPVAAAAPAAAEPPPIREAVTGNTYTNETYGFSMFKPPGWELIAGARTLLPGAITAMGTGDETTYLLIGQGPAKNSIDSQMNATLSRLGAIMDNFSPLAETHVNISGTPAIERRFHGSVDQHDWSGVVVLIPRGPLVFTIFGMTYAETDLVQIQENVIARTIFSIEFAKR